jgi:2-hydroxychromene-2-carboxylate isomerase
MPTSSAVVEFWFEFASTYTYPAAMRIERLALARGIELRWQPFLLGPIFREQGWSDSPFNIYPVKGRYMWRDLQRTCAELGLEFKKPSQFPRNGLLAARVACAFTGQAWVPSFVRNVYTANFVEDRDIADPEVLAHCLAGLVEDPAATMNAAGDAETKARLRQNNERATALDIFGSPSFVVAGELFWGNDRLEAAFDWSEKILRSG